MFNRDTSTVLVVVVLQATHRDCICLDDNDDNVNIFFIRKSIGDASCVFSLKECMKFIEPNISLHRSILF